MHSVSVRSKASPRDRLQNKSVPIWKCLCAELLGTFFLTVVATLPVVLSAHSSDITHLDKVVSPGLLVMVMIYGLGNLSGAHFNPAVTLAFTLRGAFNWAKAPGYWLCQLTGALIASFVVKALAGDANNLGATLPHTSNAAALATEVLLTSLLVFVILATSKKHKIVGKNAALAVGATISLCGMIGSPLSGASMNPARSIGPAIVSGSLGHLWIYVLGPICGASIAALLFTALQGWPNDDEEKQAEGEDGKDA